MPSFTPDDYTIAWICALPLEAAAARAMLDKIHTPPQWSTDPNAYELGELNGHYIVIVLLPAGVYGTVAAATVVSDMLSTFPGLRFGLMVGIGGGVPGKQNNMRLGDVVVSKPGVKHSGVMQYAYGKAVQSGQFEQTGTLNKPPQILLTHMNQLQAKHMTGGEDVSQIVQQVLERYPNMKKSFCPPGYDTDYLFQPSYHHASRDNDCGKCDKQQLVERQPRDTKAPHIHYGLIASADQVMKDAKTRDRLAQEHGILCFEMEAAGLMDKLPTLVIRGICDYCDSHKQKQWQGYAALAAAAYAKLLLSIVPVEAATAARSRQRYSSEDQRCLQDLLLSHPDDDRRRIEGTKGGLLDDSFRWILASSEYQAWWNSSESQLLWIKGDAGKGKTMLMIGIIKELLKPKSSKLLAYFLCQGTDRNLNNATAVLRGLIYMLITKQPHLISRLRQRYDTEGQRLFEGSNAFYSLSTVFENMIEHLQQAPVHLLIDALDECKVDLENLLKLIAKTMSMSSVRVKWIVSSRNMGYIEKILNPDHEANKLSLELNTGCISHAIETYINYKVLRLRILESDQELQGHVRDQLSKKADGTFLWVALVIEELRKCELEEEVLDALENIPTDLFGLYNQMIEQIDQLKGRRRDVCIKVLSMAVLAYRPLHLSEMRHLTAKQKKGEIERTVGLCGSFLTIRDEYVYLIHQSAKDHLDKIYADTAILQEKSVTHHILWSRSIEILSIKLRRNLYNLDNPGLLVSEIAALRPHPDPLFDLRYSCTYWLDHFIDSGSLTKVESSEGQISEFFKQHLLHWLESLGLIGELRHGILSLKKLSACHTQHQAIFKEAERFASGNAIIIQEAPLQTYSATLVFCPQNSLSKKLYWDERFEFIERAYVTQESWDPCMQVLEGHTGWVTAVAFSPGGQTIVSAAADETIRLWDAATGSARQTLQGHTGWVIAVAFSPDGQIIASAAKDGTIRLWDAATGTARQTLQGHITSVEAVAFSPGGQTIASAATDGTIWLWDAATGAVRQTLQGHTGWVTAVAFSPDGQIIASAATDGTIQLWDTAMCSARQTLHGHMDWVTAVAFSPDGQIIASAAKDGTIRLWDAATGSTRQTLQGHTASVEAVAFSPDGQIIASAAKDGTIWLWDAATGAVRQTLQGHTDSAMAVAFSPNGQTIASAADDKTIRLWDAASGSVGQPLQGHTDSVIAVAFSPDGQKIASAADDKTIRLWDAATGSARQTLQGHTGWVTAVAFSPEGQTIASASYDRTIRLWDTATGSVRQTLQGHTASVEAVAFSPDGQTIASAADDKTIWLWDAATGAVRKTLQGHTDSVTAVAFSSDGQTIASTAVDKTIWLWDAATGAVRKTLQGHTDSVTAVAFSPDGQTIASAAADKTIRLWDAATGSARQIYHSDTIFALLEL
ncbi:Pfs, NACHT and WD domain protein [Aspergillus fischeri NRRL 181]|uniref:Wd-repeat protein n=1 Tax=Neosartorya fischeri (strain ATCC 1020 / DSM 3700 / CBS 544.65 / FGSC A1164 / JCM 1740 / NRRL 181 / WB 181) TaxID=331117 RepID=A1DJ78_NEOFI|nr:wd-repeat protein [Aspergillus fischeri NRRL 181]EAW16767.1 wd-repeat protein [Aspergillus fischeri NRRL 181]